MMPKTYDEWKKCIVKDCKIDLTKQFAEKRIFELKNSENTDTVKFINLYGKDHYLKVIEWFSIYIKNECGI